MDEPKEELREDHAAESAEQYKEARTDARKKELAKGTLEEPQA